MKVINKAAELKKIAEKIKDCKVCKEGKSGLPVAGEGNPDATIMFIGEAPGKQEAKTGRPFIGRSGKFLRKNITEIGLDEEDVFITSPVKYLPDRGTPTPADIAHGKVHLLAQISVIKPKVIVLLGSVATLGVLQEKIPVAKEHGTIRKSDTINYFLMYHPAVAIRFARFRIPFQQDFLKLKRYLQKEKLL